MNQIEVSESILNSPRDELRDAPAHRSEEDR
jgi:hypothetical protein